MKAGRSSKTLLPGYRFLVASCLIAGIWSRPALGQYVDTLSGCIQCHETGLRQNDFCPTIPAAVWSTADKHAQAFYLLHESDPRRPEQGAAKRALVKQILGFELREAFTDERYARLNGAQDAETVRKVATVKACLRCHATWPHDADEQFATEPPVTLELGVSCQACHGPGEKWDVPHRLVAWRVVTPAAKSALGFADCRSPAAKARLCASCHMGNIAEQKFVKHEWYAAGHPPLPSFELASFVAQMPLHWRPLREKGEFAFRAQPPRDDIYQFARQAETLKRNGVPAEAIKNSYLEANFPEALARGVDPSLDLPSTKEAIIGGAVVLETYARLVADATAAQPQSWPELALYDCSACHHELRRRLPTANPARRHPPGRPPLADWPQALAKLAAQQAGGYRDAESASHWDVVSEHFSRLEQATTRVPFGDRGAMHDAAIPLAEALATLTRQAAETRFDGPAASAALGVLTQSDLHTAYDFASARQTAWAITAIAADLQIPAANHFFARDTTDPLCLRLPSGPNAAVMENLRRWRPAAAQFDATWYRNELSTIQERLARP